MKIIKYYEIQKKFQAKIKYAIKIFRFSFKNVIIKHFNIVQYKTSLLFILFDMILFTLILFL